MLALAALWFPYSTPISQLHEAASKWQSWVAWRCWKLGVAFCNSLPLSPEPALYVHSTRCTSKFSILK